MKRIKMNNFEKSYLNIIFEEKLQNILKKEIKNFKVDYSMCEDKKILSILKSCKFENNTKETLESVLISIRNKIKRIFIKS